MFEKDFDNRFLRTKLLLGADNLEKLHRAKVTIVGLGGLWAISFFFKEKIMNKKEA